MSRLLLSPLFAEGAVWEALRQHPRAGPYHAEREVIYALPDDEDREAAFIRLHDLWFHHLNLGAPIRQALDEQAAPLRGIKRRIVALATDARAQGAELFVDAGGSRTLAIQLLPATLVRPDRVLRLLRRELLHIVDMLDEEFRYEPRLPARATGPARDRLLQERYRILWSCSVAGRLVGEGRLPAGERDLRMREFRNTFGFLGTNMRPLFERLFDGPRPSHPELVEMASDPSSSLSDRCGDRPMAHRCPLCGFPTSEFEPDPEGLSSDAIGAILSEFPDWRTELGVCRQCADLYRARSVSEGALARLPGQK